jgi:hypothetical protein
MPALQRSSNRKSDVILGTGDAGVQETATSCAGNAFNACDALQVVGEWAASTWPLLLGLNRACTGTRWAVGATVYEEGWGGEDRWCRLWRRRRCP